MSHCECIVFTFLILTSNGLLLELFNQSTKTQERKRKMNDNQIKELDPMKMVEAMQKAINYMEEHLLDPLTIEEIALQAHLSPFHFQRIFMILTDVSVMEYIRRRRLTLAAHELIRTDTKIIDLSYRYGYETPEAFSKAFRRQHGVTPSEVRKGLGKIQAYNRITIQVQLKGAEPMNYQIVKRDAFQVVGVKREFPCDTETKGIPQFWGEAHQNGTIDRLSRLVKGQIEGLLGVTCNYRSEKNTIDYFIAVEHEGDVPAGLSTLQIPAAKWAVFETHGPVEKAFPQTWKKIYSEWIPSNGYQPAELPAIEAYLDPDVNSPHAKNQIWLAIK